MFLICFEQKLSVEEAAIVSVKPIGENLTNQQISNLSWLKTVFLNQYSELKCL